MKSKFRSLFGTSSLALSVLLMATACGGGSASRYCDATTSCLDPAYPFCDFSLNLCVATAPLTEGTFTTSWDVTTNTTPVVLCADEGASFVETIATDQLDPTMPPVAYADKFDCDDFGGVTFPMPLSDYTVAWGILNSNDLALTPFTEPAPINVTLAAANVTLPMVIFDF